MKSFILSISDNLKKANNTLDAKAVLCGNSWEVFNDEGIKQIFIFNKDNSLLISTNGDVETFSWQYIPTNNSIIITTGNKTSLFRPAFHNDVIFALQKDGTEEYYFLINESNVSLFPSRKLEELKSYFNKLELSYLENERRIIELEHKREEEARQNKLKAEQEAEEESERTLLDIIESPVTDDPQHILINQEDYSHLESKMTEVLSELEQQVLERYLAGQSYFEISEQLNRHVKSIDNALQRVKRKLERHLEFGEMSSH